VPLRSKTKTVNQSNTSLPERWRRNRRRAAAISLALVLLGAGVLQWVNATADAEEFWLGVQFSSRELVIGAQEDKRIVIVELDDKSLKKWREPFIAWGGHIADAIDQLNRSKARVIALDWTQTIETEPWLKRSYDQKLGEALSRARNVVFVKFIKPDASGYVLPTPSLLYAIPGAALDGGEGSLGYAEVGTDRSEVVWKSIQPMREDGGKREVSFAGRIALKAGFYANEKELPSRPLLVNFGNYAGKEETPFEHISIYDLVKAKRPDPRWKDKIVLIGATYTGSNDFHHVPFFDGGFKRRLIPGVEVQAHAVKTLLDRSEIKQGSPIAHWLFATLLGALGILFFSLWNWNGAALRAVGIAFLWTVLSLVLFIWANFALPLALPVLMLLAGSLLMGGYRALSEERERAQVMKVWGRQQDPRLINELLANPDLRGGQGREMTVTVLFADLKNFTKTVEMLPPDQAIAALNRYLSLIAEVVLKHGGLVDKYLGDGLMAQWGAPLPDEKHALLAVRACLDMQSRINALTEQLRAQGEVWFEARLTLHSGPVLVGAVGAEQRLEFTIIGDTVNVTSRLQETAKAMGCDFLISETTCELLDEAIKQQVVFGRTDEVEIRGRQQPLEVFEVLSEQSKQEGL
jgi:adenylate cyclase